MPTGLGGGQICSEQLKALAVPPREQHGVRLGLRAPSTSRDEEETGGGLRGRLRSRRRGEHAKIPLPIPLAGHPLVLANYPEVFPLRIRVSRYPKGLWS